jgi:hypothetical protein
VILHGGQFCNNDKEYTTKQPLFCDIAKIEGVCRNDKEYKQIQATHCNITVATAFKHVLIHISRDDNQCKSSSFSSNDNISNH